MKSFSFFCCPSEEFVLPCARRNFTLSGPPAPVKVCLLESLAIYTAWQHPCALPTSFVHFPPILQDPLRFRARSNFGISQSKSSLFFAVTFPICMTKHLAENTQAWQCLCLVHLSLDKKYPLSEVVFIFGELGERILCPWWL